MITQVEILEKERAEERKRYEAMRNLMLSDFAHDLRTPIMTIGGYANAITDGMVKDEAQKTEYLTAIAAKSKRMTELITMLFEYVRVGSGLGLSVVKQVMDMHGFDIHLKQPYGNYSKAFVLKFYECSIIDI
ncbi:histidine kinase dimerization/phospho-acceptor domain-containing protein [Butyrivibrio sp. AE2032]|uniref:histidine kinase dimerization/phospho-acceptor domain-containing protein n=1 Tax=Butyrivibrio sp. AE2032 TaxID=1458463 RepID=UPI00055757FB|nr:sensor histidine kinase [Butyrivibrio sp. AE2032]